MATGKILGATFSDSADELSTGLIYKYSNIAMEPLKEAVKNDSGDDSILLEALESGLNTFQFATMNAVINVVEEYVIVKVLASSATIFAYIKGTSIASSLRNKTQGVLTKFGKVGGAVGKFVKGAFGVVIGTQEERLIMAQMANSNVNNITSIIAQERQNQTMMRVGRRKHFDTVLSHSQKGKMVNDDKKINLFLHKMKSGTWKNSKIDKKLYEQATGFDFDTSPVLYNKNFVQKINNLSEYAKDVEGNTINWAQSHLDYVTALGQTKV